jgi:hypothetical protein
MKKSLSALIVIIFSIIGAKEIANKFDYNVKKTALKSSDTSASDNEKTGGACRKKFPT